MLFLIVLKVIEILYYFARLVDMLVGWGAGAVYLTS